MVFYDYGVRPKGSPEIAVDPVILESVAGVDRRHGHSARRLRTAQVAAFIIRVAMEILPPKQRKVFYSVWGRSGGSMAKGIMEFSRRIGQSHYSNYNSAYKSYKSVQEYLKNSGYEELLLSYLSGRLDDGDSDFSTID